MKKHKKLWIVLAVVMLAGFWGIRRWKAADQKAPSFRPIPVARGDIQVNILTTGVVQPRNRLEIKPSIAGRAEEVLAREGQWVKKGDVLAWMSSTERAALLDAARAKGAEALSRWEELYKPTPLVAPLNGTIISRNVEPGQTVTAQDAVLVMSDRLIVKAQVDETDIGQVELGQKARVSLDAYPQETVGARVEHIAYEAKTVNNVTIYEVDVLPLRPPAFLRSGMTANVTFQVASRENTLLLPAEAVRQEEGRSSVMLPNPAGHGKPEMREIETGLSDGKNIEVLSGLQEGDRVLAASLSMPGSRTEKQGSPLTPWGRQRGRGNR
ncbi:MAG: efflux RND transporter periplasmic adaptor subunit [Elusimicrobia bacterium]|nr:efflux RND transporter periplasmic adaptor subunit [Elusimicrobiota bacterium]